MGRQKKSLDCSKCGTVFASRQSLYRHIKDQVCTRTSDVQRAKRSEAKIPCPHCGQKFTRNYSLKQHLKYAHSGHASQVYLCGLCPEFFRTKGALNLHRRFSHAESLRGGNDQFRRIASAHRKACEVFRLVYPQNIRQSTQAIQYALPRMRPLLQRILVEKRNARVAIVLTIRFQKAQENIDGDEDEDNSEGVEGVDVLTVPMSSRFHVLRYPGGQEQQQVAEMLDQINHNLDAFVHNGSGWVVSDMLAMDLQVMQCQSLAGSCTLHSVTYQRKMGIVVKHQDDRSPLHDGDRCFYRAVGKALLHNLGEHFPTEQRIEEFVHAEICENVSTPVDIKDIGKFEIANAGLDLSVNVLYQDEAGDQVYPARASPHIGAKNQVNLLLFHMTPPSSSQQDHQQDCLPIMHYAWIPNLGDVIGVRKKSQNGYTYKHDKHLCFNCFLQFHNFHTLVSHAEWCHTENGQRRILPEEGECVRYDQRQYEVLLPWFFVFDFETLQIEPEKSCSCKPENRDKCVHKTKILTEQKAFAYALIMVDKEGKICEDISYLGEDAADHFIDTILDLSKKYAEILEKSYKPLKSTPEMEAKFEAANVCYICSKPFNYDKVRDHDHMTGK